MADTEGKIYLPALFARRAAELPRTEATGAADRNRPLLVQLVHPPVMPAPVKCNQCRHCLAPPDPLGTMALCALDGLPRITTIERECVEFERVGGIDGDA